MTELTNADFSEFFQELWGHTPFAWQKDLATRVLEESDSSSAWPDAIALPTASGKTACMDIAVFALAAQASRLGSDQAITAPRRIFFVVDRRVIVDQAFDRASDMSKKLSEAKHGILKEVADRLRQIAHGSTSGYDSESVRPLAAHMLRGGMYRSEAWARDPLQPMVVASTVDQVGSRLLFRAYGRGSGTAPVYAGLVANDSLILLDEAHCAQPFMQTLQAVSKYRDWAHEPLGRAFYPVIMSATPPSGVSDVFRDESSEKDNPDHTLGKRQLAEKLTILKRVTKAKGKQAIPELSEALAKEALDLVTEKRRAIVVFVNRVATARETHRLLESREDVEAVLLTGRMRAIDKEIVKKQDLAELHSDHASKRDIDKPKIVVSTQTLEVGADLDFDGLVTECASLDALRQRFGRLNRTGRPIEARGVVLIRDDQAQPKRGDDPDPVYGDALKKTWDWLDQNKNSNGEVDFGISNFGKYLSGTDGSVAQDTQLSFDTRHETARPEEQVSTDDLNAPSLNAAVMLPAHVDCWAQTSPQPEPSPDVALFLHGPREGVADVQVCWRTDLDLSTATGKGHALESLALCPPSSPETLPVPIGVFKRWLSGIISDDDTSDVEGVRQRDNQGTIADLGEQRNVVRWHGSRDTNRNHVTSDPSLIRPGDVIVVPTNHPADHRRIGSFALDHSESPQTLDIGDQAHLITRAKPVIRLHPNLIDSWPPETDESKTLANDLLKRLGREDEEDPDELDVSESAKHILEAIPANLLDGWSWLSDAAKSLRGESPTGLRRMCRPVGNDRLVIVGSKQVREYIQVADAFSDEDDASSSSTSHGNDNPVELRSHLSGVESCSRRYAQGCGLPEDMSEAVSRAGLLHDLGKADPRFQVWLRGGKPWLFNAEDFTAYWAKSASVVERSSGIRHELYSVRLAENSEGLLPENEHLRDLVLHLIASHHGRCRPFAPVVMDEKCEDSRFELCGHSMQWSGPTKLERLDSGIADRYWRLVRRYGWWGLAWLEGLVRLADWRRSEWEETYIDKE